MARCSSFLGGFVGGGAPGASAPTTGNVASSRSLVQKDILPRRRVRPPVPDGLLPLPGEQRVA